MFTIIISIMIALMALGIYAAAHILRMILPHIKSVGDTSLPLKSTLMQKIDESGERADFRKQSTLFAIAFAGLIATFPFLIV